MKRAVWLGMMLGLLLIGCRQSPVEAVETAPQPTETPAPVATPEPTHSPSAILVTLAPTATPTPTPTATPTPTPSPEPTPSPTPAPTPFTLAWVPDTQLFAYFYPQNFPVLAQRINEFRERENILGVIHTGDLVDNGFKDWQWDNFEPFLTTLDPELFFFPVAGNHDIGTQAQNFAPYLARPFLNAYPEEQKYQGGKMLYRVVSAGDTDILLLGVGWELWKDQAALRWIDDVLRQHQGMPCVLVVHGFLLYATRYYEAVEQLIAQRPAIRLAICGHMEEYYTRVFTYDDDQDGVMDRQVTAMMLNMQYDKDYAFRLLTFDPVTHSVNVRTFMLDGSPAPDMKDRGPISFVIENAF